MRQPAKTDSRKRAANRKTKRNIAQLEASGLTPLDYLLSVIRNPKAKATARLAAAVAALPYTQPQIAPLDIREGRRILEILKS